MAKKKTSGPNMSELIRKVLRRNRNATNEEVFAAVKKKIPSVNAASCGVATSNQRKRLGFSKKGKGAAVRPRRPIRKVVTGSSSGMGSMDHAFELLKSCGGDRDKAVGIVDRLVGLQLD